MYRFAHGVLLKYQHAGAFRILGIVLDEHGSGQSIDDLANKDLVGGEFLVPVNRNPHLAACHECSYFYKGLTQCSVRIS